MAINIRFFMTEQDELAFLRLLGRFRLEVYPVRVSPDWKTFYASEETRDRLPEDAAYLAAADLGPVRVDKVKRGPDKGSWRVDEVRSPVIFFERSKRNEEGELMSGQLWTQLDWTPQTGRRYAAPDRFRTLFLEIERRARPDLVLHTRRRLQLAVGGKRLESRTTQYSPPPVTKREEVFDRQ